MRFNRLFFAIIIVSCISILLFGYLLGKSREANAQKPIKDLKKNIEIIRTKFQVVDDNEIKFDDLINKHCKVEIIKNISRFCLRALQKYDLKKLSVEIDSDNNDDKIIYYHTYWQPETSKPHHKMVMNLNVLSFLATQDLKNAKYIVWTSQNLNVFSDLVKTYDKYVKAGNLEFRVLDLKKLCSVGAFLHNQNLCEQTEGGGNVVMYSDFVRFLVLNTYGGIYIDGDVIFLRDMKPFWHRNFVYRWSFTDWYNTAVMGFVKDHGDHVEFLYQTIIKNSNSLVNGFYPLHVKDAVARINNNDIYHYRDLEVFNSNLFDPAWLCFDTGDRIDLPNTVCGFPFFYDHKITREEFDKNGGKFFDGAFTYHLHLGSCGTCQLHENSYFNHVQNTFKSMLR